MQPVRQAVAPASGRRRRRVTLYLIAFLALSDILAAAYLKVLWDERHGGSAVRSAAHSMHLTEATPHAREPASPRRLTP